jgi:DNA-binding response OmpR family regulator
VPKVMIVDDDRTTVSLLETLLELDGFDVVLAADGNTALAKAQAAKPDAFLVDFHLADREGTDFVRQLRGEAAFSETPVIMASGAERGSEAYAAGADHFLIKPFDPGELVSILNQMLGL